MDLLHALAVVLAAVTLTYFAALNLVYLVFTGIAWRSLVKHLRARGHAPDDEVFTSPVTPPVSVLVPAYDEGPTIVESVRSLLSLRYPQHEVIVVNDGSTDDTLERLDAEFDLVPVRKALRVLLPTAPIRGAYVSRRHRNLWVVDKENGGKSDALNAAVNASRYPYVCAIDADAILEEDALLRVARPIIEEPEVVVATGGIVRVWRNSGTPVRIYEGPGPVTFVTDPAGSLEITQKGTYRGNTRFVNSGGVLRVVNYVNYDDYAKGVIRKEMLANWHHEAYKAQAYAAKAYAYTSYRGSASDYDVRDDQLDQCYGGLAAEEPASNAAVDATRGKIPTYNGQVIRAYFSASSGGVTVAEGCWGPRLQFVNGRYQCGASQPYLVAVQDPADLRVSVPAINRHASWQATFTSAQIRNAVLNMRGVDIGSLLSVDVSNVSPEGGHVVSLLIRGSNAVVDVQADVFLRTHLSLKSTFVRLSPF